VLWSREPGVIASADETAPARRGGAANQPSAGPARRARRKTRRRSNQAITPRTEAKLEHGSNPVRSHWWVRRWQTTTRTGGIVPQAILPPDASARHPTWLPLSRSPALPPSACTGPSRIQTDLIAAEHRRANTSVWPRLPAPRCAHFFGSLRNGHCAADTQAPPSACRGLVIERFSASSKLLRFDSSHDACCVAER
jgi:hypothetical protein